MVMEAPPSPLSVGREFVRQYYTLLNKAPHHLHRFYNHQSSFVHGGLDPNRETSPVIGQKQIHQKIQQLNFHDCHAKITQVDSQATLGGGVVVQVTGELSNAGQPMRRFTQTFVLAAQSPKKYYVHNDIFRYQDEIITIDEECEQENRSEPENEEGQTAGVLPPDPVQQPQQPVMPFFGANAAIPPNAHIQPPPPPPHVVAAVAAAAAINGNVHPDDISSFNPVIPHVQTIPMVPPIPQQQPQQPNNSMNNMKMDKIEDAISDIESNEVAAPSSSFEEIQQSEMQDLSQSGGVVDYQNEQISSTSEPKTYANLLKSSPFNSPPQREINVNISVVAPPYQNVRPTSPISSNMNSANFNHGPGARNKSANIRNNQINNTGVGGGGVGRMPRPDSIRPMKNSNSEDSGDSDRRRSQSNNYSDINQLFLGNLPLKVTEDELREIFIEFGAILDLKVHSKSGKPGMPAGARPTPNYGFITFETIQGMQNCLAAKPIHYPKGDKNGIVLNVEEKKTKERQSYGGGGRLNNDRDRGGDRIRDKRGSNNGLNRNSTTGSSGGAGPLPGGGPNNRPTNNYRNGNNHRGGGGGPNTYNNRR